MSGRASGVVGGHANAALAGRDGAEDDAGRVRGGLDLPDVGSGLGECEVLRWGDVAAVGQRQLGAERACPRRLGPMPRYALS